MFKLQPTNLFKMNWFYYSLIFAVGIQQVFANEGGIEDIFEILFDTTEKPLHRGKTMDYLKKLQVIRARNPNPEKAGSANEALARSVLSVSELSTCDKSNFLRMNFLIGSNPFFVNIVSFVKHYREKLFRKCEKDLQQTFLDEVFAINSNTKNSLVTLRDKISFANDGFKQEMPFYSREALNKGIVTYLHSRPTEIAERMIKHNSISKDEFEKFYTESILDVCNDLGHNFITIANIYLGILHDAQLRGKVDSFTQYWIVSNEICKDIIEEKETIPNEIYLNVRAKTTKGFLERWREHNKNIIELLDPNAMP